jgi:hypothetical protein
MVLYDNGSRIPVGLTGEPDKGIQLFLETDTPGNHRANLSALQGPGILYLMQAVEHRTDIGNGTELKVIRTAALITALRQISYTQEDTHEEGYRKQTCRPTERPLFMHPCQTVGNGYPFPESYLFRKPVHKCSGMTGYLFIPGCLCLSESFLHT